MPRDHKLLHNVMSIHLNQVIKSLNHDVIHISSYLVATITSPENQEAQLLLISLLSQKL